MRCANHDLLGFRCVFVHGHTGRHAYMECGVRSTNVTTGDSITCTLTPNHQGEHCFRVVADHSVVVSPPNLGVRDPVNRSAGYTYSAIEPIDVIEAWALGFCLGQIIKYVCRAGKKPGADDIQDLKKAAWYLNREIKNREKNLHSQQVDESAKIEGPGKAT